ncbi:MAG TPA: serine hydrolase domain-containing protein, partial [Anaerolineae bacterium]|nr:serine hydrolase domain-containing protein [Anaerolineae bacterium]
LEESLQSEIDAVVGKDQDVFSAVLGVVNDRDDFRWAGAAGTAYAGKTEEMQVETPIYIASITKMYVAAATMILKERGLLSLDEPLSKYLPAAMLEGLHRYKGRDYSDQLRIYHLVSQTSGLPDYFMESPRNGQSMFDRIVSGGDLEWGVDDVVEITKTGLTAKFPPEPKEQETSGRKAHYSDTNYQLLGSVIEVAAQKPLHQVLTELVIEPLELSSTYVHGHGGARVTGGQPPASIYYKTQPLYLDKAMTSFGPDGGMVSNVEECLRFLRHFMQGKLFEGTETLERMQRWKRIFFPFQYGLGLMRFKLPRILSPLSATPELIGHSGATSAFLFYSDIGRLYIGGTLNQLENQGRPVRLMIKLIGMISEKVS